MYHSKLKKKTPFIVIKNLCQTQILKNNSGDSEYSVLDKNIVGEANY